MIKVEPAYTSQRCHLCGGKGERFSSIFKCKVCGKTCDADFNASVNIARRAMSLLAGLSNPAHVGLGGEGIKWGVGYF